MENEFLVDSQYLSEQALAKKHRLETDPSFRKSHMEYLPGMEQIQSDVCEKVMSQVASYDYTHYTAKDVRAALSHPVCSLEDFKALLSSLSWKKWPRERDRKPAAISAIPCICLPLFTLPITARITAYTVVLTAITISTA